MSDVLDWLDYRVISCYHEASQLKEGVMCTPRMAVIYPTYICNHQCIGCDYAELNSNHITLNKTQYKHVVDEVAALGVESIEHCGGGEPTLNPHWEEMCYYASQKHGLKLGLLTNGTMLYKKSVRRMLLQTHSYVRVSVEAGTEETFKKYKGKDDFWLVVEGMKKLVEERDEIHSKLQISYKFSVDKNNYRDIPMALAMAHDIGVDSIQFKAIRNVPSELKDNLLTGEDSLTQATHLLKSYKLRYPSLRVMGGFEKSTLQEGCWLNPLFVTIDPLGEVFICCYYRHRMADHRLGNLFEKPLERIWYSQDHWNKIGKIDTTKCNLYDCRFHHYNKLMEELVVDDKGQLDFI